MNRGSILHEELTYAMLHEMVMKKFNLEAIYPLNLSARVTSIDDNFDITDDREVRFFVECASEDELAHLVAGKIQLFVSHHQIDLSTMLISNDGSLEEALEAIISEATKQKLEESLSILHQRKNEGTVTRIKTGEKGVFEMLSIALGASIRTFVNYLRPLLMIDAAHLKGLYKGTNLTAVGMDGNNQIVPIAFGICKGETEIKQRLYSGEYARLTQQKNFSRSMSHLQDIRTDAYDKLCQVGPHRWSRAHCPLVRYNYLTSNSVKSVNACTVVYTKLPVLKLAETYRAIIQEWVAGKIQLFVSHHQIDLSTMLISNDGSLEEALEAIISEATKQKLEESLSILHRMQK
nr:hypothetical protein [Tanacetum cinerariifolium]